jgi:energy-coupling factor transporter ATP-binding protein EcfA2
MKLLDFRIMNFRSIKDTGWCPFSSDATTVLIGQNESGKSSILSALDKAFAHVDIDDDDRRAGAPLPSISIRVETDIEELQPTLEIDGTYTAEQLVAFQMYLGKAKGRLEFVTGWILNPKGSEKRFSKTRTIEDTSLPALLAKNWSPPSDDESAKTEDLEIEEEDEADAQKKELAPIELTSEKIAEAVFIAAPLTVLFDEKTGLLPNTIDIETKGGKHSLSGDGLGAAQSYLKIAGITLDDLVEGDPRSRTSMLDRGNKKVSSDFASFWSQTIGKRDRLLLKCELQFYGSNVKEKSGKPYLVFWISDGQNHLYPRQRSTGVRWFLSFYLQLKEADENAFFLLDEPGANLHSRAQADVLNLINRISQRRQIMYSTHSPHMVEYDKLFRVLAVQREGDEDDTPTVVMHAHRLGSASRDTLSPILTAMGADFSQQGVIKKRNNVILEEISGFYYLKSFWKLTSEKTEAHFIAATGANNVESLANMFLGWDLEFIIAVDDDQAGRSVLNGIKRNMFADDDALARSKMIKIDGRGIEDVFDRSDFKAYVLEQPDAIYEGDNSQYVKDAQRSKPMLAYQFWIKVLDGKLKLKKLGANTQTNISNLVREISSRLS